MTLLSFSHRSTAGWLVAVVLSCSSLALAASPAPAGQTAEMPSGLRKEAAYALLTYFLRDMGEQPEISARPKELSGLTTTYHLTVRYAAKVDGGIRCTYVESPPADAEGNFRFSLKKPIGDEPNCGSGEKLVRFQELETMMARIQACEKKGENRCLVSDPGNNNRRILVLH